jgi:hypothetical protein
MKSTHLLTIALGSILAVACTSGGTPKPKASPTSGTPNPQFSYRDDGKSYTIYATPIRSGTTPAKITLKIDLNNSSGPITDSCPVAASCECYYTWKSSTNTSGVNQTIDRAARAAIETISQADLLCQTPAAYNATSSLPAEIKDGDEVRLTVIPTALNPNRFAFSTLKFTKTAPVESARDFSDPFYRGFSNVKRFTCYDRYVKGTEIRNKLESFDQVEPPPGVAPTRRPLASASSFCYWLRKVSGGTASLVDVCEGTTNNISTLGPQTVQKTSSAQTYPFHLYRPTQYANVANIKSNSAFSCGAVDLTGPLSGAYNNLDLFPNDATFSLAQTTFSARYNDQLVDFTVGVPARTGLGGADNVSQLNQLPPANCVGAAQTAQSAGSEGSMLQACLGFAAKPLNNGSCPKIEVKGSSGTSISIPTFRLRRYIAAYPHRSNANGSLPMDRDGVTLDYVYVLDRGIPLTNNSGAFVDQNGAVVASVNDAAMHTIAGPKPCPFAWYARKGIGGLEQGRYIGTNRREFWEGKNPDGTELPFEDRYTSSTDLSCSSAIAVYKALPGSDPNAGRWSIATLNDTPWNPNATPLRRVAIRPINAWTPQYLEDTDFQACAPRAMDSDLTPVPERAPVYQHQDGGEFGAYCSMDYPNRNEGVPNDDGSTSKVTLSTHTEVFASSRVATPDGKASFGYHPLVAPPEDLRTAMEFQSQYRCNYTYRVRDEEGLNRILPSCCYLPSGAATSANENIIYDRAGKCVTAPEKWR